MPEHLQRHIGMSVGAWIAFGALAVGLIGSYGGWQHSDGLREGSVAVLQEQVRDLQREKEAKAQQVAVLTSQLGDVRAALSATNDRLETQRLLMENLREKLAENGWRPLATRR
jgi:hypothetical protein